MKKKYLEATSNFNKNDPSTHVKYDYRSGVSILIIETPDKKLVPYKPKVHNDPSQPTGLLKGHVILEMAYKTYCDKTKEERDLANYTQATRIPPREEIDFLFSQGLNAYVAEGFDPSKGDANTKWNVKLNHTDDTKILVLEDRIFGMAYQPYIPSVHGQCANYTSATKATYMSARGKARKIYRELTKNNINPTPNFTSTTTTTSTSTTSHREVEPEVVSTNTAYLTARDNPRNQFKPTVLIHDYEQINHQSEDKDQGTENSVPTSQTGSTTQQRKRVADDSVLNSTPSFSSSSFALFQANVPAVPKDPTQPKRFRPWE